jgi:hypothetical protein
VSSGGDGVTSDRHPQAAKRRAEKRGEKICHIVEHDDRDRAICGKDVMGYPWNPPWPVCVVCVDLYEQGRGQ